MKQSLPKPSESPGGKKSKERKERAVHEGASVTPTPSIPQTQSSPSLPMRTQRNVPREAPRSKGPNRESSTHGTASVSEAPLTEENIGHFISQFIQIKQFSHLPFNDIHELYFSILEYTLNHFSPEKTLELIAHVFKSDIHLLDGNDILIMRNVLMDKRLPQGDRLRRLISNTQKIKQNMEKWPCFLFFITEDPKKEALSYEKAVAAQNVFNKLLIFTKLLNNPDAPSTSIPSDEFFLDLKEKNMLHIFTRIAALYFSKIDLTLMYIGLSKAIFNSPPEKGVELSQIVRTDVVNAILKHPNTILGLLGFNKRHESSLENFIFPDHKTLYQLILQIVLPYGNPASSQQLLRIFLYYVYDPNYPQDVFKNICLFLIRKMNETRNPPLLRDPENSSLDFSYDDYKRALYSFIYYLLETHKELFHKRSYFLWMIKYKIVPECFENEELSFQEVRAIYNHISSYSQENPVLEGSAAKEQLDQSLYFLQIENTEENFGNLLELIGRFIEEFSTSHYTLFLFLEDLYFKHLPLWLRKGYITGDQEKTLRDFVFTQDNPIIQLYIQEVQKQLLLYPRIFEDKQTEADFLKVYLKEDVRLEDILTRETLDRYKAYFLEEYGHYQVRAEHGGLVIEFYTDPLATSLKEPSNPFPILPSRISSQHQAMTQSA